MNKISVREYDLDGLDATIQSETPQQANRKQSDVLMPMIQLSDIYYFAKRSWLIIVISCLLTTVLASAYLFVTPKVYTASTSIIYDPSSAPQLSQNSRWLEPNAEMTTRIESQVEVIKSESIATAVINELGLRSDPEFRDRSIAAFLRELKDRLTASMTTLLKPNQEPAGNGKKPANFDDLDDLTPSEFPASALRRLEPPKPSPLDVADAVPKFLQRLRAHRVGMSAVIDVSFRSQSPEKATRIANTIAKVYFQQAMSDRANAALNGSRWLRDRIEQLRAQAFNAMRLAERFKTVGSGSSTESAVRLAELESIAQTYRRIYETFLLKLTETTQRISYPVADARIVSLAVPSRATVTPKAKIILAFAIALGTLMGIVFAIARQSLDRNIRSPRDLTHHNIAHVSTFPNHDAPRLGPPTGFDELLRWPQSWFRAGGRTETDAGPDCQKRIGFAPTPAEAAALRQIQTAIFKSATSAPFTVGVVGINETTDVSRLTECLARTFPNLGAETLLCDLDFTMSQLTQRLGLASTPGISDISTTEFPEPTIIRDEQSGEFSFLPVGNVAFPQASFISTLAGMRKDRLIDRICNGYDIVFLALPSLEVSVQSQIIAGLLDAVVVVAEIDTNQISEVKEQIAQLEDSGSNVLGVALQYPVRARRSAVLSLTRQSPLARAKKSGAISAKTTHAQ